MGAQPAPTATRVRARAGPEPPSPPPEASPPSPPTSSSPSLASSASSSAASSPHTPTASPTRTTPSTPPSPRATPGPARPRAAPPPPGLFNLGNTCYLNSVVQVLYHIPAFRAAMLATPPPASASDPPTPTLQFAAHLVEALRRVFALLDRAHTAARRYHAHPAPHPETPAANGLRSSLPASPCQPDPHAAAAPRDDLLRPLDDDSAPTAANGDLLLRDGIEYIAPQQIIDLLRDHDRCLEFDARGQQDAHEFLRFLLDKVNDCMQMDPDPRPAPEHNSADARQHPKHVADNPHCDPAPTATTPQCSAKPFSAPAVASSSSRHPPQPSSLQQREQQRSRDVPGQAKDDVPGNGVQAPILSRTAGESSTGELDPTVSARRPASAPAIDAPAPASANRTAHQLNSAVGEPADDTQKSPAAKRRRREMEAAENGSREKDCSTAAAAASDPASKTHGSGAQLPNGGKAREASDPERRPTKRHRRNVVPDLFQGRAVTATRCYECDSQSERWETFLDVSLPVGAGKSLEWAMSTQCIEEQLLDKNKYYCDNCKTYTEAKRWWQVASLPRVFTVHLKLFAYGARLSGAGGKVSVAMPCPIKTKLAEWCDTDCAQREDEYKLTAVIVHEGTGASSGHYYSYVCKTDQDCQWYCCDDSFVSAVSEDEVKERLFTSMKTRRTAYLLFYTNAKDLRGECT